MNVVARTQTQPNYQELLSEPWHAENALGINQDVAPDIVHQAFVQCYVPVLGTGYLSPFGAQRLERNVRDYKQRRVIPPYVARYLEKSLRQQ